MKRNRKDCNGKAQELGGASVESFELTLHLKGVGFKRSSEKEDIYNHIDYWVEFVSNNKISVDLKSLKRIQRHGKPQNKKIWIEFKNVLGKDGWILGKADYICFEQPYHFLFVKREELFEFCKKNISKERVYRSKDAEYKLYRRKDRKDIISIIYTSDVLNCPSAFLIKKIKV